MSQQKKRPLLTGRVSNLTQTQVSEFWKMFEILDRDQSGKISSEELRTLITGLGHQVTRKQVSAMLQESDKDGNGELDFDEFLAMMAKSHARSAETEEKLQQAFKIFDKDGNGVIDPGELKTVMRGFGENLTDAQVLHMMKQADIDEDGVINYEEFAVLMIGLQE